MLPSPLISSPITSPLFSEMRISLLLGSYYYWHISSIIYPFQYHWLLPQEIRINITTDGTIPSIVSIQI